MIEIKKVLGALAEKRPIFHSEADFQHSFAWEMHHQWPGSLIRLEVPLRLKNSNPVMDIRVEHQHRTILIELKYKTCLLDLQIDGEKYQLKSQSAQDIGRYDFLKDIRRLEQAVSEMNNAVGYAIFLSNDSSYWKQSRNCETVDCEFRIHDGRLLEGHLKWAANASEGTKKNREHPIELANRYSAKWEDYSKPSPEKHVLFRLLIVKVGRE